MSFLDKLKPQPRWKHADPAIRLEALKELEDPVDLATIAEGDPDVRVRRAAAGRVLDPAVLGRLSASDPDTDLRDRASERLLSLASRPARVQTAEAPDTSDSLALLAVAEIHDVKRLSIVAKSDAPDAVRDAALSRIDDDRALGSIARHAKRESTALAAVLKIGDRAECLKTALEGEHRDVSGQAFDRLVAQGADVELLRTIETDTAHKSLSRKARTMIQDIETAEAARLAAVEDRRRRESLLVDAMEQVASVVDLDVARAEHVRLDEAWLAAGVTDAGLIERYARAASAAEAAINRRQREADEAADMRRMRFEAIATREALCGRVETLDGDDVLEQLVPIEEEWRSLLPLVGNGPEADRLAARFAQAVAACRKRHEMTALLTDTRARLGALVADAETLPSLDDTAAAAGRWQALSREARGLTAVLGDAGRPDDELSSRLDAVAAVFKQRESDRQTEAQAALQKVQHDAATQLRRLVDRATRAAAADAITLREGDRLMRDIVAGVEASGAVAASPEINEALAKLRGLQEQVAPRVRELREMDEWRRFANAQRQEQLIAMAEAIVASVKADDEASRTTDLAATARALRELHTKWQEVAEAPRQSAQRLWDRFRTATDFIRSRCEPYFAEMRQQREVSLQRKTELVVEAETLAASNDWAAAAGRFQELQQEWQALGPGAHEAGRELMRRFRAACNSFFARRREDLADRKKTWAENLTRKEALSARAEELANSTDWDTAVVEMKRLQAEWKTIGPVRRNKSEAVWNRFRAAADSFFDRFHHRHELAVSAKLAEREALVVELEGLAGNGELSGEALAVRVADLKTTWNRSVPIPSPAMKPLADRWQQAVLALVERDPSAFAGTDLDPQAAIQKMEKLAAKVETFLSGLHEEATGGLSATELLAAKLRSAFASNAMGASRSTEDAKLRAAADGAREAQATWSRLAPVSSPEAKALEHRFRDACRRINDQVRRRQSSGVESRRPPRPAAAVV